MTSNYANNISVVDMGRHFLYLPLYYAIAKGRYGSEYQITARRAHDKTDVGAMKEMLDTDIPSFQDAWFAVGDPTTLLSEQGLFEREPVILASMVTNGAFWAVNCGTHSVKKPEDLLKYGEIYCYQKGTTAHSIVRHLIANYPSPEQNPPPEVIAIRGQGQDLTAINLDGSTTTRGKLAITPDILDITVALESGSGRLAIETSLSNLPDFAAVLVTALVTRREIIVRHADFVRSLLVELQKAMLLAKMGDPRIIEYGAALFNQEEETVGRAIERANDALVFPTDLCVSSSHWRNAVAALCPPDELLAFEARHQIDAEGVYRSIVRPYKYLQEQAAAQVITKLVPDGPEPTPTHRLGPRNGWSMIGAGTVWLIFGLLGSSSSYLPLLWALIATVLPGVLFAGGARLLFGAQHMSKPELAFYWIFAVATIAAIYVACCLSIVNFEGAIGIAATFFVASIGFLFYSHQRRA